MSTSKLASALLQLWAPRISFSNDFSDSPASREDSEQQQLLGVTGFSRLRVFCIEFQHFHSFNDSAADKIFTGKLLPLKERKTMLRDELLAGGGGFGYLTAQVPKGESRWKDRFSLMRSGNDQKKSERRDGCLESVAEEKSPALVLEDIGIIVEINLQS
uniref:Uncharacterized protein n=1 Tax=Kalanchoe fedtschenkoi TaxID=63787 RepID=A0A7N0T178_KALFE